MWFTAWKYYKWREYKGCEVYIKWCCQSVKYLTNLIGRWFQCIFQSQRPAIIMISNKQTITNSLECHFIVTDVYIITTRYTHTIHTFQALLTFAMSWRWRKIFLSLKKICMILRMFLTRIHFLIAIATRLKIHICIVTLEKKVTSADLLMSLYAGSERLCLWVHFFLTQTIQTTTHVHV